MHCFFYWVQFLFFLAIKKEPDGTITKVMWEAADGSYIRPDGFEWKKVQGESPRKYLREPSTFEGILEEGVTPPDGPDQGKPAIFKFANPYDEGDTTNIDAELIDIHRADALRDLQEYLYDAEFGSRCDGTPYHPKEEECTGEAATKITASGTLYSKKVGGIEGRSKLTQRQLAIRVPRNPDHTNHMNL